jgi:hypothetical protein
MAIDLSVPPGGENDIDEQVRALIRRQAQEAAVGPYAALVTPLYRAFDELNEAYFDGLIRPTAILISPPTSAKAIADACHFSSWAGYFQIRLRPTVVEGRYPAGAYGEKKFAGHRMRPGHAVEDRLRYLADNLLHEMMHVFLDQQDVPRRDEYKGHGPVFTDLCNAIGAKMGLPKVFVRRRKDDPKSLPLSADWPCCVRPGGEHGSFYGTSGSRSTTSSRPSPSQRRSTGWSRSGTTRPARPTRSGSTSTPGSCRMMWT